MKILTAVMVCLLTLAAYWPALHNEFVMDDTSVIGGNQDFLDVQNYSWFFSARGYFEISREESYRPIVTLTHILDARVWRAQGGHILNLALHAGIGFMLADIGFELGLPAASVLLGSALFLVHPAYSETVYVITYREDLLCGFFLLVAFRLLLGGSVWWAQAPYLIALFSKEIAVPLPLALWVLNRMRPGTFNARQLTTTCAMASLYIYIRFFVFPSPNMALAHPTFLHWAPAEMRILLNYARLIVWPDTLSIDHRTSLFKTASIPLMILASAIVLFSAYGLVLAWRRRSLHAFFFGWGPVMSIPVWNLISIANGSAERYLYIPMIFPSLGMAHMANVHLLEGGGWRGGSVARKGLWVVIILILAALGARTHVRGYDYRNYRAILQKEININPKCAICAYMLSLEYENLNDMPTARHWAERSLEIDPEFYPAHLQLARSDMAANHLADARKHLDYVLKTQPIDADVALHVACYYMKIGDTPSAQAWASNAALTKSRWPSQLIYDILRDVRQQIHTLSKSDTGVLNEPKVAGFPPAPDGLPFPPAPDARATPDAESSDSP